MSFEQALFAAGLRPRIVVADGKWRRCQTDDKPKHRNGAYILHEDGRGYWRNWAVDQDVNSWTDGRTATASRIDPAVIERRKQFERDQRMAAIHAARAYWGGCKAMRDPHPYLQRKGLSMGGCAALRVHGDLLVVPVWWKDRVISVQTITTDGQKRFWPGAPVKSGHLLIQRDKSAVTAVCEGLATGLAVYQSVKNASVIVAFDAGNLTPVIDLLRPTGSVVVCADNDHGTMALRGTNPGIEKARNAAELIGAGVAWPEGIEGTDWADALAELGEGASRKIERQILAKAVYVM
jgi:putative DNA primase/helicase